MLHLAALNGPVSILELLLTRKAKVEAKSNAGTGARRFVEWRAW